MDVISVRTITIVAATVFLTGFLQGCVSLPALEGNQVYISQGRGSKDPHALDELSKIDLVKELDPSGYGCELGKDGHVTTETQRFECALKGFYSYKYFEDLPTSEREALKVNNITNEYAENALNRIGELSKTVQAAKDASYYGSYFAENIGNVQTAVVKGQMDALSNRLAVAETNSGFLEYQRRNRNRVQSRILSASDAACDLYKRDLNGLYSNSNFVFGTLATVAGGAGAVITKTDAARALAGLSGVTSGTRAEFNDAYFRNKVVELLTKAMDIARDRKREEIRRRSVQLVADYSVEDAINDGISYNSNCSLVAGLQETSDSLKVVSDPGLKWLANAFGGAASKTSLTKSLFDSLGGAVGAVQQIQRATEDPNSIIPPATQAPRSVPDPSTPPPRK